MQNRPRPSIRRRPTRAAVWVLAGLFTGEAAADTEAEPPRAETPVLALDEPATPPAPDEVPVALSVGLGLTLALAPMVVAGGMAAQASDARTRKRSLEVLAAGLALGPVLSHLIAGEGSRAAVFGGVTLTAAVMSTALLETLPRILDDTKHPACVALGATLAGLLVASGYGLVDSLMAGERSKKRRLRLELQPTIGPSMMALGIKGRM
jgi:hypothetical protein